MAIIKNIKMWARLVHYGRIVGVRFRLLDGSFTDVDKETLKRIGVAVPKELMWLQLVKNGADLLTEVELQEGIKVRDGSTDKSVIDALMIEFVKPEGITKVATTNPQPMDTKSPQTPAKNSKETTIRRSTQVLPDGTKIPCITPIIITISEPTKPLTKQLTEEDVWGIYDIATHTRISKGLIVANYGDICPVFGDKVPCKAVTVVGKMALEDEIVYWLEYVQGVGCVSKRKIDKKNGNIALRAEYQCW